MWKRARALIDAMWVAHLLTSYGAVLIWFMIAMVWERPFHLLIWCIFFVTAPLSFIPFAVFGIMSRAEGDRWLPVFLATIYVIPMTTLSTVFYRWTKPNPMK